jgi:mono/diheme cytochrome c family protein
MPKVARGSQDFEPAWLQRSLDRYYTWGLVFMTVLIVGFPLYRLREPHLRSTALNEQHVSYVTTGAKLFALSCASCHGANGTGGTAPTLNAKEFLAATSDAQIGLLVTGGVSGSSMSAWSLDYGGSLTDEQIRQLTTYLRSLEANAPSIPDWRKGAKAP